ncbi:MAG: M23 family metallopeptidase [Candidatus Riflebacteria bacterium]|nr:M23 family metallopeptidase [Candidatus Riflebacteria bacterium]
MFRILLKYVVVFSLFFCFGVDVSQGLVFTPLQRERISSHIPINEKVCGLFFRSLEPKSSFRGMVHSFSIIVNKPSGKQTEMFASSKLDLNIKSFVKSWIMPVAGVVSSGYGYRKHPFRRKVEFHSGVDLRANRGTLIRCVSSGMVTFAGWKRGYGLVVEVDHGFGVKTLYGHCSRLIVKTGVLVKPGDFIGRVGSTGTSTGNHLHFEVIKNQRTINPSLLMKF